MKMYKHNRCKKYAFIRPFFAIAFVLIAACSSDDEVPIEEKIPSVEPIEAAMKTMTPLGYAASMFMNTLNVADPASTPNTTCTGGDTLPLVCVTALEIPFDQQTIEAFPVPLETAGQAMLYVAGAWSDDVPEAAVISLLFIDMKGGTLGFPAYKISTIPVSKTSVGITTYYSSGDIGVDKETAIDTAKDAITSELDGFSSADLQSAITRLEEKLVEIINNIGIGYNKDYWVVNVEDANPPTPDNYFDDLYGLSGGGLYIDVGITGGTAYQVNLANVVMGNNCKINPSAGEALINELEVGDGDDSSFWPSFGSVTLAFNDVCDGQAYVENGIGSYGPINGERVPLKFND